MIFFVTHQKILQKPTLKSDERRHLNLGEIKSKFESLDCLVLAEDFDIDDKVAVEYQTWMLLLQLIPQGFGF